MSLLQSIYPSYTTAQRDALTGIDYGYKRTGANDRDYTMCSNLAHNNSMICYKALDFSDYFTKTKIRMD